jgi:hypothetical protein
VENVGAKKKRLMRNHEMSLKGLGYSRRQRPVKKLDQILSGTIPTELGQ